MDEPSHWERDFLRLATRPAHHWQRQQRWFWPGLLGILALFGALQWWAMTGKMGGNEESPAFLVFGSIAVVTFILQNRIAGLMRGAAEHLQRQDSP